MDLIPSFDLLGGQVVRLRQGDFEQKTVYPVNPLDFSRELEAAGFSRLQIIDLDGALTGKFANLDTMAQIAAHTRLNIDFGGGLRSIPALKQVWDAGGARFSVGSMPVLAPDEFGAWVRRFGPDKFVVSADARNGAIAIHGWTSQTEVSVFDFIRRIIALGIHQISVTDIEREGGLAGPALDLYADIRRDFPNIHLIASGGVRNLNDLENLASLGCAGVIIGKALLEGEMEVEELSKFIKR